MKLLGIITAIIGSAIAIGWLLIIDKISGF